MPRSPDGASYCYDVAQQQFKILYPLAILRVLHSNLAKQALLAHFSHDTKHIHKGLCFWPTLYTMLQVICYRVRLVPTSLDCEVK